MFPSIPISSFLLPVKFGPQIIKSSFTFSFIFDNESYFSTFKSRAHLLSPLVSQSISEGRLFLEINCPNGLSSENIRKSLSSLLNGKPLFVSQSNFNCWKEVFNQLNNKTFSSFFSEAPSTTQPFYLPLTSLSEADFSSFEPCVSFEHLSLKIPKGIVEIFFPEPETSLKLDPSKNFTSEEINSGVFFFQNLIEGKFNPKEKIPIEFANFFNFNNDFLQFLVEKQQQKSIHPRKSFGFQREKIIRTQSVILPAVPNLYSSATSAESSFQSFANSSLGVFEDPKIDEIINDKLSITEKLLEQTRNEKNQVEVELENYKNGYAQLLEQYNYLYSTFTLSDNNLKQVQSEKETIEYQYSQLYSFYETSEKNLKIVQSEKERIENDYRQLYSYYETSVNNLKQIQIQNQNLVEASQQVAQSNFDLISTQEAHNQELTQLQNFFQTQIVKLQQDHESTITQMKEDLSKDKEMSRKSLEAEMKLQLGEISQKEQQLKNQFEAEKVKLFEDFSNQIQKLRNEFISMKTIQTSFGKEPKTNTLRFLFLQQLQVQRKFLLQSQNLGNHFQHFYPQTK